MNVVKGSEAQDDGGPVFNWVCFDLTCLVQATHLPGHNPEPAMYSSTFIFAKKQYDDAFYRLDQMIAEMAKEIPGYLGVETWENADTGLISNVYYWETLEALQQLVTHPRHLEAKAKQDKGWRVSGGDCGCDPDLR